MEKGIPGLAGESQGLECEVIDGFDVPPQGCTMLWNAQSHSGTVWDA